MWTHVSDAALMDVVEGAAGERAEQHVAQCAGCRARVDEARAALGFAAAAAVPEPIPAYWDVMRRRVAHALVEAPAARSRRPLWAAAAVAGALVIAARSRRRMCARMRPAVARSLSRSPDGFWNGTSTTEPPVRSAAPSRRSCLVEGARCWKT